MERDNSDSNCSGFPDGITEITNVPYVQYTSQAVHLPDHFKPCPNAITVTHLSDHTGDLLYMYMVSRTHSSQCGISNRYV